MDIREQSLASALQSPIGIAGEIISSIGILSTTIILNSFLRE